MPTGYTQPIQEGITFEQYALNCARAFGALIMMRDEPSDAKIPDKFESSEYSKIALQKANDRFNWLSSLSEKEWQNYSDAEYKTSIESWERNLKQEKEILLKYNAMLVKAKAYVAPSPDHVEFRSFMIKQIEDSIAWDCNYYLNKEKPKQPDLTEFKSVMFAAVSRDIDYHTKAYAEEVERTNGRNKWISDLRNSLK